MIEFNCSVCNRVMKVEDLHGGKSGKCPSCGERLRVPETTRIAPNEEPAAPDPVQSTSVKKRKDSRLSQKGPAVSNLRSEITGFHGITSSRIAITIAGLVIASGLSWFIFRPKKTQTVLPKDAPQFVAPKPEKPLSIELAKAEEHRQLVRQQVAVADAEAARKAEAERERWAQIQAKGEANRKDVFLMLVQLEKRATDEAIATITSDIIAQVELERNLKEKYKDGLADEYGITRDKLHSIMAEGVEKNWLKRPNLLSP